MTTTIISSQSELRTQFFELLFGDNEGFVCIAVTQPALPKASFKQRFFQWPLELLKMENYILSVETKHNVYFCVNLLDKRERNKANCLPTNLLWADCDLANPDVLEKITPPILIRTSPDNTQAIWRLSTKLPAHQAEEYSRRIAYAIGADNSGWDLTQLLRVPFTRNLKYVEKPMIVLERALTAEAPPLLFETLPPLSVITNEPDITLPDEIPHAESVIYKYTLALRNTSFSAVYTQELAEHEDWSKHLWRLIHVLFEAGMSAIEVFAVANSAPSNKYVRDGRPIEHLWKDVLKAELSHKNIMFIQDGFEPLTMPPLVSEPPTGQTFMDRYRDWAEEATDAIPQFHDLSSLMLLSCIISGSVRLETSYGIMVPNLWGMILGDSTLSRKTTAMRMVIDMLMTLDNEMVIATDGTAEGLLTGLQARPNRVSMFYKDEISGFFDSINRKDYLAGMPETLTALYDVPPVFTRRLRKETIHIEAPSFVFFGGGVRDKVFETLSDDFVLSGFLPRFLVVSGETQLSKLRRTGPANDAGIAKRGALTEELANLYELYSSERPMKIGGQTVMMPARIMAYLTNDAWEQYGELEELMVREANDSSIPSLALPTFERLSRSLLKTAIVLGAARQTPDPVTDQIVIERSDVLTAAWYIQDWGRFSVDLVQNAGMKKSEKLLSKIVNVIAEKPGILRSTISQHYHLSKKEADDVLGTLEDRQLIRKEPQGRGTRYFIA